MLAAASSDFELTTPAEVGSSDKKKTSPSKEDEEAEVLILSRPNPLLMEFNNPRFSDVSLVGFGKSLKLHKILLVQSPYLKSKILQDGADLIFLELSDWPTLTRAGMETALLDLYHIGDLERRFVTPDNVFSCFLAACFLELIGLAQFCTTLIQKQMCDMQNLLDLVHKLGQIKPLVEASDESNHQLLSKYFDKLHRSLLGSILYAVSLCTVKNVDTSELSLNPDHVYIPTRGSPIPACLFIAQLPLKWIESILCSNQLPIENEFLRYELTKAIFKLRSAAPDKPSPLPTTISQEDWDDSETVTGYENGPPPPPLVSLPVQSISLRLSSEQKKDGSCEIEGHKELKGTLSSIFNFFSSASSGKKRKLDVSDPSLNENEDEVQKEEAVNPPLLSKENRNRHIIFPAMKTKKPHSPMKLPATLSNIYENGIIYTYMTFAQLGIVKKDEIVPFHVALESYWLQAEMSNGLTSQLEQSPSNPGNLNPFRFGFKFENVSSYFKRTAKPSILASDSVICAGVQYRLLLTLEPESPPHDGPSAISTSNDANANLASSGPSLRALLQKSKGRGPPGLSYSIYAYDHRRPLVHQTLSSFLEPVTRCLVDGEGYANLIPVASVKCETDDSIFLTITLSFLV